MLVTMLLCHALPALPRPSCACSTGWPWLGSICVGDRVSTLAPSRLTLCICCAAATGQVHMGGRAAAQSQGMLAPARLAAPLLCMLYQLALAGKL